MTTGTWGAVGTPRGVGARVQRSEDERHLHGRGGFVADIALPGLRDLAFVRSPVAHGRLLRVRPPDGARPGEFWTGAELADVARPIVADARHPDWRGSEYPLLADDRVRFVGEPVAAVVAPDRAAAEDLAEQVELEIDELPVVVDPVAALAEGAPRLHGPWPDNRFLRTAADLGDVDGARAAAAVSITRDYVMGRHSGMPMETRGAVAAYDRRLDQLVVHWSTQVPHLMRAALADLLGLPERRIRVVAPDVGGGFGIKCNLDPEVVVLAAIALRSPYPVRWIEDRWEHFVGAIHARDHRYRVTAHAAADGELLAVEADVLVDAGAYSVWPWTAAMEAGMAAGMLPGPYRLRNYRFSATTVATNKPPLGPYRGVARPGACFAIERTMDELAIELGMEPRDVRLRNLVQPDEHPYTSITGRVYDSGDYPESVRRAAALVGHDSVRERQRDPSAQGRKRIGLGYAVYTEQTAHGTAEWAARGLPVVFGFEQVRAVLDPSGSLTLGTGIQSHGQGLETSLAQVAHDHLGIDPADVSVRHGDTDTAPYGMGTFASRSMVMAGGATHQACSELAEKVKEVAAALMGCATEDVALRDGKAEGPTSSVTLAEVARAAYLRTDLLPERIQPSLDVTSTYRPVADTGAFSYATHAAVVELDTDDGSVRIVDYVVVEDCGTIVNPLIVDGQIQGGVAQGIGTALLEEFTYDEVGQPKVTTFMDYLMPGATEVPEVRIEHMETPSPFTTLGIKGMGEGGAIAPPAAIANALTDALRPEDVAVNRTPITPERIWLATVQRRGRDTGVPDPARPGAWP
jgi:carbon-monoxide dehydrogenase large subunit